MKELELLNDPGFRNGFWVLGRTHEDGLLGAICWGEKREEPAWHIAQWECGYNIMDGKIKGQECFETPSQRVALTVDESGQKALELTLRASREYRQPRIEGQAWPHLLIEQDGLAARCPRLNQVKHLYFESEVRIVKCRCAMQQTDRRLHAAQANLFFTIGRPGTDDMYWFGVPYYDSRAKRTETYMAEDGGKADASHKFIYIMPQRALTDHTYHSGEWIRYERDLYPDILEGLKTAGQQGWLSGADPSDYTITSMNFGWEMPGTYDGTLLIRHLSLKALWEP